MNLISRYFLIILIAFGVSYGFYHNMEIQLVRGSELNKAFDFVSQEATKCDILFIGNSRTSVHVNPKIIDSLTGMSSYCIGPDGASILVDYMFLKKFLETHDHCKFIVVNLDYMSFYKYHSVHNYPSYYTFLQDSSIYNSLAPYSTEVKYFRFFKPFTCIWHEISGSDEVKLTSILNLSKGKKVMNIDMGINYYKGYWGSPFNWKPDYKPEKPVDLNFDESGFKITDRIIELCKRKNCNLLFVYPPVHKYYKKIILNYKQVNAKLFEYVREKNIPYLVYTEMDICNSKEYFYNIEHMNYKGANIFSTALANDIRKIDSANTNSNTP